MLDHDAKELCLKLMQADTEEGVIGLLQKAGLWDDPACWRFYGDSENNYSTAGNQQSHPEAALVEKLVNSVDARLMCECRLAGIDPEGEHAPQGILPAVSQFFSEKGDPTNAAAGKMTTWSAARRTEVARDITFAATGFAPRQGDLCITISDHGEGQTPRTLPDTILSLDRKNKQRIPFVQGKFNMGGTGVLKYCGRNNLQLVLSRRNTEILEASGDPDEQKWGFTVVRRENPSGGRRNSVYTYLAPAGADTHPSKGHVLLFAADEMPIFPEGRNAYARPSGYGTLIKLYEYAVRGHQSNILMRDGLLSRMELLLPDVALPVRFHECRENYKGHAGSFETTMTGLAVRLEDDKADNLEFEPSSCPFTVDGEPMTAKIYAFKKGKSGTYRKREGIIFTVNGQTHGYLSPDFFRRKKVNLSYLSDSILVVVDCSHISGRSREDLFMNSRDRLSGCPLRHNIETELESILRDNVGLRELRERRRREEIESKLSDQKPLEDILDSLLKRYPSLSNLFSFGKRISDPFKKENDGEPEPFEGKHHPTFFRFRGKEYGHELHRDCHINMRARVDFETDVVNDYFERTDNAGMFSLELVSESGRAQVMNYSVNLHEGGATLNMALPGNAQENDRLRFECVVNDPTLVDPFKNSYVLCVKGPAKPKGGKGERRQPSGGDHGRKSKPARIALPNIAEVFEKDWGEQNPPFDRSTALRIRHADNVDDKDIYDFIVNMDNVHLKTELKRTTTEIELTQARFKFGLVLLGLAVLQESGNGSEAGTDGASSESDDPPGINVEDQVEGFTRAVAPMLLPMIESLGALDIDDLPSSDVSGEVT